MHAVRQARLQPFEEICQPILYRYEYNEYVDEFVRELAFAKRL